MTICSKWIITVLLVGLFSSGVVTADDYLNDFEVFAASSGGEKSQSLYPENQYDEFNGGDSHSIEKRYVDLSEYEEIAQRPPITQSRLYISPESARYTRNAQGPKDEYTDGYRAFLDKYFAKSESERPDYGHNGEKSASYKQESKYNGKDEGNDDDDDDDDEGDDEDNVEEVHGNSNQRRPNNDDEYERIKLLSQEQEKEIKQNPKHCKVEIKGDMKCSICKNPETGAHSESCSFSSNPAEKKYAYIKERKYNSKDDDKNKKKQEIVEDDSVEEEDDTNDEEASNKSEKQIRTTTAEPKRRTRPTNQRSQSIRTSKHSTTPRSRVPRRYSSNYKAEESRQQSKVVGLDPFLYGGGDDSDADSKESDGKVGAQRNYEDYFSHVFPEDKNQKYQEAEKEKNVDAEFLPNYESKKNVEQVLAEFKTRDWSQCKKHIKGDLTCYQCEDEYGVKHEECMFVSGSAPKSSRLAYREIKSYHDPESSSLKADNKDASSDVNSEMTKPIVESVKTKLNKKLVVRKRKAKVINKKYDQPTLQKPEDVTEHQSGNKRSIKRMVAYRYENSNNNADPLASTANVMHYESNIFHDE